MYFHGRCLLTIKFNFENLKMHYFLYEYIIYYVLTNFPTGIELVAILFIHKYRKIVSAQDQAPVLSPRPILYEFYYLTMFRLFKISVRILIFRSYTERRMY